MRAPNISWGAAPETILYIYPLLANHYTSQTDVWCLVLGGRCLLLLLPWWLTQFLLILILPLDSSAAIKDNNYHSTIHLCQPGRSPFSLFHSDFEKRCVKPVTKDSCSRSQIIQMPDLGSKQYDIIVRRSRIKAAACLGVILRLSSK